MSDKATTVEQTIALVRRAMAEDAPLGVAISFQQAYDAAVLLTEEVLRLQRVVPPHMRVRKGSRPARMTFWTQQEVDTLLEKHAAGKSWYDIAMALPGRSEGAARTKFTDLTGRKA